MNWLAHVALSDNEIDHQLGNLVADVVKGRPWPGASDDLILGMEMHKKIDSFTDSNPVVWRSISRLGEKGKLRGVAMDIIYDHMLTINWARFCDVPLRFFLDEFYRRARAAIQNYPTEVKGFVESVIDRDRLGLYTEPNSVWKALIRIDERLSERLKRVELASSHFPMFLQSFDEIEADFLEFYPLLSKHVATCNHD